MKVVVHVSDNEKMMDLIQEHSWVGMSVCT